MINYGNHYIDRRDILSVTKALKSKKLTQGQFVEKFEKKLNIIFKSKYSCAVSNGTAGLHLCCLAIGVKNTNVLISSNTFLSGANAIIHAGGKPSFVDIDLETGNISVSEILKRIKFLKSKKEKISAIIATDYAGSPCDWESIKKIARKYKLKLINDNCHAIGAEYKGKNSYATKYADLVVHSYHPVKNVTTAEGGAILTNEKKFITVVKNLRNHGLEKIINSKKKLENPMWPYRLVQAGFNYRISDIQCSLGVSQLNKLKKFLNKRRKIAKKYDNFFKKFKTFKILIILKKSKHACHLYVIRINFKKNQKKKFIDYFAKNKIFLQNHYFPIHLQPYYKKLFDKQFKLKNTVNHFRQSLSLPIYYNLKFSEQKKVIDTFIILFKKFKIS